MNYTKLLKQLVANSVFIGGATEKTLEATSGQTTEITSYRWPLALVKTLNVSMILMTNTRFLLVFFVEHCNLEWVLQMLVATKEIISVLSGSTTTMTTQSTSVLVGATKIHYD